jgi:hypothetical protein
MRNSLVVSGHNLNLDMIETFIVLEVVVELQVLISILINWGLIILGRGTHLKFILTLFGVEITILNLDLESFSIISIFTCSIEVL